MPAPFQNGPRKRSYYERGGADVSNGREEAPGGRAMKQPRRGARFSDRGGRADNVNVFARSQGSAVTPSGYLSQGLQPPPFPAQHHANMPHFDPNNPVEALLKMQAMGIPLPQLPPTYGSLQGRRSPMGKAAKRRRRCRDFETKGFCTRKDCRFEHGSDAIYVPPSQPMPLPPQAEGQSNPSRFFLCLDKGLAQMPVIPRGFRMTRKLCSRVAERSRTRCDLIKTITLDWPPPPVATLHLPEELV